MNLSYSHGRQFVEEIRPILETGDASFLTRHLRRFWPSDKLKGLLDCGHEDAVCLALVGLSFVGSMGDCAAAATLLHDDDGFTADMAEHALWSIWFRSEGEQASEQLAAAISCINEGELDTAGVLITKILRAYPGFAEAYHQLSLIHFLRGEYAESAVNCRAALALNPWHFGAMATLGHCHAAAGRLHQAFTAYQQALKLHPRLQGVRQAICQIRRAVRPASVNSFTNF